MGKVMKSHGISKAKKSTNPAMLSPDTLNVFRVGVRNVTYD